MLIYELPRRTSKPPAHPAVVYRDIVIAYEELDELIYRYASFFSQKGLQPGDRVAIALSNSPAFILSYLGVVAAGGIAVPLNLLLTPAELAFILADCKPHLIITQPEIFNQFVRVNLTWPEENKPVLIIMNRELEETIRRTKPLLPTPGNPHDVCVFLYTSGTTGTPKAAMLSHYNLISNVIQMDKVSDLDTHDNFLCVLPMFHSFGWTTSVLLPLYLGSTITVMDSFRPKEVVEKLKQDITVFCGVPTMYSLLLRAADNATFPRLKLAIAGGAALGQELSDKFYRRLRVKIKEGYGLSEASPVVALTPLNGEGKPGSVGKPLPGIEVRITGDNGRDVPIGEVGELVIKGPNVMAGYYNRPQETANTLRDGWLYTGDLARQDEDGFLYLVGRKKELIISSGFNIYPREIEEAITAHPQVAEAAVIGVPDPTRGEAIKALVVLKPEGQLSRAELLQYLQERIARYKLPHIIEFVPDLPKNAAGKILKRLLK